MLGEVRRVATSNHESQEQKTGDHGELDGGQCVLQPSDDLSPEKVEHREDGDDGACGQLCRRQVNGQGTSFESEAAVAQAEIGRDGQGRGGNGSREAREEAYPPVDEAPRRTPRLLKGRRTHLPIAGNSKPASM